MTHQLAHKMMLHWFTIISMSFFVFCLQSETMHVKWIHMERQADAPIFAFSVAATSPELAAAVLATIWALMDRPAKVSFALS